MKQLFSYKTRAKRRLAFLGAAGAAVLLTLFLWSQNLYASVPVHFTESQPIHCSDRDFNCNKEGKRGKEKPDEDDIKLREDTRTEFDDVIEFIEDTIQAGSKPTVDSEKDETGIGYILNYENYTLDEHERRGEQFVANLFGAKLYDFGGDTSMFDYATSKLRDPKGVIQGLDPIEDPDIVVDYKASYEGGDTGLDSFFALALDPRRNPYGITFLATDMKLEKEYAAYDAAIQSALANRGFRGERQWIRQCDEGTDKSCYTEYETLTPGGIIADELSKALTADIDWFIATDETEERRIKAKDAEAKELPPLPDGVLDPGF